MREIGRGTMRQVRGDDADAGGLAWLLAPLPVEEFIAEIWEQRPHVIQRNDRGYFRRLFSAADFDTVLEFSQPLPPALRVVLDGDRPSARDYVQSDGLLDLNQLRRFYAEGHTIVVNGLQRYWAPVAELVRCLQRRLNYGAVVNAYLTPRGARGFRPHYDTHDVLVVQVGGMKAWRLYHCEVPFPLSGTAPPGGFSRDQLPEPRIVSLSAGDVMYIPRGWIHEAETVEESSLHLTIGIHPPLWVDLVAKALADLALRHERLRRALPVGFLDARDAVQSLGRGLEEMARLLEREGSASEARGMLEEEFLRVGRSAPDGKFAEALDRLPSIALQTRLIKRPHLYSRVVSVESSAAIQYSRSLVQGPEEYRDAMNFVATSKEPFAVSDLPGLDDERKVSLAQRLVRDGLLAFADTHTSGEASGCG